VKKRCTDLNGIQGIHIGYLRNLDHPVKSAETTLKQVIGYSIIPVQKARFVRYAERLQNVILSVALKWKPDH